MINRVLKLIRQFHRLSQTDLAQRLEISKPFLSQIESGKKRPTLELIERYAQEFQIPASTLMMFAEKLSGSAQSISKGRVNTLLKFLEWAAEDEDGHHATT